MTAAFLPRARLDDLIAALAAAGRRVLGPTVAGGAIVVDEVESAADLPAGWGDEQGPGRYRLVARDDERVFAFASGPAAWKRELFAPHETLHRVRREDGRIVYSSDAPAGPESAFVGVRACDLAAIGVQDRVFCGTDHVDAPYRHRREGTFVVAVECTHPAATCFCTSMGTGPEVQDGADLVLVELAHGFVVRTHTDRGADLVRGLGLEPAQGSDVAAAGEAVAHTRSLLPPDERLGAAAGVLRGAPLHPRWSAVADRCLACTNCTLACPTCFCNGHRHVSDLDGQDAALQRHWDSCFTLGFGAVAGGNFRPRVQDRYRQWLTHKFSTWHTQFGTTGCVGCGRCITWCPVGIDVREEVAAIVGDAAAGSGAASAPAALDRDGLSLHSPVTVHGAHVPVPVPVDVVGVGRETRDTVTLAVDTYGSGLPAPLPGQFVLVDLPGVGAPPISVSRVYGAGYELTVRAVGPATRALCATTAPARIGVSPPRGRPWPLATAEGRDVVVVAGGIGLAPVRPVVDAVLADPERYGRLHLFVGARTPGDLVFRPEFPAWFADPRLDCAVTVDRAPESWQGPVGVVTHLFDRGPFVPPDSAAFVCGPEAMMLGTIRKLTTLGLDPEHILVTTERHMDCGVGLCGHCQLGPFLTCRDGPVFSAAELAGLLSLEGV